MPHLNVTKMFIAFANIVRNKNWWP